MRIVWSDRSIDRLVAIHDYIAEASSQNASNVVHRIFESVEQLRVFPKSGRILPDYQNVEVREILSKPYRILYRELGDSIEIVNILHVRQQL